MHQKQKVIWKYILHWTWTLINLLSVKFSANCNALSKTKTKYITELHWTLYWLICRSLYSPSMHSTCENITSFHTKLVISILVWVSDIYNYLFILVRLQFDGQFGMKWGDVSTCHVHARWKYKCRHIFQEKECFIVSHCRQFENRGILTHPLCKLSIQLDSQELCWFLKNHGTSQCELSVQIFS